MFGVLGFTLTAAVACVGGAIYWHRMDPSNAMKWIYAGFAVVFLCLALIMRADDMHNRRNNREAVIQLEARYHGMKVVSISTQYGFVHYERDGKYCESDLVLYNDQYVVTENPMCADLDMGG